MDTGTKSGEPFLGKKGKQELTTFQIYKDLNRAAGAFFRMVFGFVGINVDKYTHASPGMKRVKKKAKKRGGFLGFIPG